MDLQPTNPSSVLSVGGSSFAPGEDGVVYHFTATEEAFLIALTELNDVPAALLKIDKDAEWGRRFFAKPKVREWISLKTRQFAAKAGTTQEWFFAFGRAVLAGKMEWWDSKCAEDGWRVRLYAKPEEDRMGVPSIDCAICGKALIANYFSAQMKPSREQIEVWKELGARVAPKIERIQHEFEDADFVFMAKGKAS